MEEANKLLSDCQNELSLLPVVTLGEPSTEVYLRITQFCEDFRAATFGEKHKSLVQANRRRYSEFKTEIFQTRPNFRPLVSDGRKHVSWSTDGGAPAVGPSLDLEHVQIVIAE